MSKGYTIQQFIDVVSATNSKTFTKKGVYAVISPLRGVQSVKADTLNHLLHGNTHDIVYGFGEFKSFGKTPRARILKALQNRKKFGNALGKVSY